MILFKLFEKMTAISSFYKKSGVFLFGVFILSFTIILSGCVSNSPNEHDIKPLEKEFSVSFLYRGFGAGAQNNLGIVQLTEGDEAALVSQALLETMQEMEMNIIEPPVSLEQLIPPGETWKTDVTTIPITLVQEHNKNYPDRALPLDRIYGIQYIGRYIIQQKQFRFSLESHLYHKGIGSDFRFYARNDYSGLFFFNRVQALIENQLLKLSEERSLL